MSSFDPATVRKAVDEFTPRRPQKFQTLAPAKEVIVELRQKRASYRAIAELLTQHCLPISKTAVAAFCHEILAEVVRPRRRPNRKLALTLTPTHDPTPQSQTTEPPPALKTDEAASTGDGNEADAPTPRVRGPRIAQVRMLKPQTS